MMLRGGATGWLLVAALAGCSPGGGGGGGGSSGGGHSFACGSTTCNSATQYCFAVVGGAVPIDGGPSGSAECETQDGGQACTGGSATGPGQCGCYESPSGEITITECVP
jgi:hypothetical protein